MHLPELVGFNFFHPCLNKKIFDRILCVNRWALRLTSAKKVVEHSETEKKSEPKRLAVACCYRSTEATQEIGCRE